MNTKSAKNVREFVAITERDSEDRPSVLRTPGHNGNVYEVTLTRNGCVSVTCKQVSGTACLGNSYSVCYHVLAACEVAAEDAGLQLSWCNSQADAQRLARIEGHTFCVESAQSGKRAWGVVRGHKFSLTEWADKLENENWYFAELARKVALHSPDGNGTSLDALGQLLNKYPEQRKNLAALFPEAVLKIGREILRGEEEVEL